MRHEERFNCMEIYNSKSGGNIYFEFEDKFRALFEVYFRHTYIVSKIKRLGVQHFK